MISQDVDLTPKVLSDAIEHLQDRANVAFSTWTLFTNFGHFSLAQSGSRVLSKVKKALWSFANARSNEIEILPKLDKDFYNHPFSFLSTPTDFMFVVHVPAVETATFLKWYLTTPIPIKKRNASEYYLTRHPDFVFKNEHVSWVGALVVGQYCKTGFTVTSVTRCWNKK